MTAWAWVLGLWLVALLLAGIELAWQVRCWRRLQTFVQALEAGTVAPDPHERRVVHRWLRDAGFHIGLRVLLLVFAGNRIALQLDIPEAGRAVFQGSPLQVTSVLLYLILLCWMARWSRATARAVARRGPRPGMGG